MRTNKKGFTLIELIVVVIIIGILASIVEPAMMSIKKKAIASEALMQLGVIKNAAKFFALEHSYAPTLATLEVEGCLKLSDINGTYFTSGCYGFVTSSSPPRMYYSCHPSSSLNNAPRKDEVAGWRSSSGGVAYIAMDDMGNIYSNMSDLGYPDTEYGYL